jgi:hypothetical protein
VTAFDTSIDNIALLELSVVLMDGNKRNPGGFSKFTPGSVRLGGDFSYNILQAEKLLTELN